MHIFENLGVDIDPKQIVSRLSMWQCQVVEITKAMSYNPKVLMLDEPTSSLATSEVECLFNVIRELKKQDIIIIYISHKLHEIPQITDTITVLRDGKVEDSDCIRTGFRTIDCRPEGFYLNGTTLLGMVTIWSLSQLLNSVYISLTLRTM